MKVKAQSNREIFYPEPEWLQNWQIPRPFPPLLNLIEAQMGILDRAVNIVILRIDINLNIKINKSALLSWFWAKCAEYSAKNSITYKRN